MDQTRLFFRFAGTSNSGKTTLIKEVCQRLEESGLAVACIKHSHHSIEYSQKDSATLFQASSQGSLFVANNAVQLTLPQQSKSPQEWSQWLFPHADIILVEGWRKHNLPTFLLCSTSIPNDWHHPHNIIGLVYDSHPEYPTQPIFQSAGDIVNFILKQ